jgi:D-tyrosyl-tRNA(Tyr) deacylase
MRALIQRVKQAAVHIEEKEVATIGAGLLVFIGIEEADTLADEEWLVRKILNMRLFNDADGQMNLALADTQGHLLLVSQFTLHANIKKGNRPSFVKAAKPDVAIPIYKSVKKRLAEALTQPLQTGVFGADMQVSLVNDGPVTIWADSKNKAGL